MFRVGICAVTLALPVSQAGITMLVSVENLEEAGKQVSFRLQIRRYWTGEHLMRRHAGDLLAEGSPGMLALQTVLFPFLLRDLFLSLGAQREVLSQVNLGVGGTKKSQVFLSPLESGPHPQGVLMSTGPLALTCSPRPLPSSKNSQNPNSEEVVLDVPVRAEAHVELRG